MTAPVDWSPAVRFWPSLALAGVGIWLTYRAARKDARPMNTRALGPWIILSCLAALALTALAALAVLAAL